MSSGGTLRERLEQAGPLNPKALVFEVLLPPRGLSPNRKGAHWASRLAPTREYRGEVKMLALSARTEQGWAYSEYFPPVVSLEFNVVMIRGDGRYRPRDEDNAIASFKAGFDGMTDAGIWRDDSVMSVAGATITRDSTELPGVKVTVRRGRNVS